MRRKGGRPIHPVARVPAVLVLGLLAFAAAGDVAAADCVTTLSQCAVRCDETKKAGDPARPECASTCISGYNRCEQLQRIRSNLGGTTANQGKLQTPAQ